ncbi:hypothetical protein FRX31_035059 [Thalictrum thalictroides]|uniref:Uncharacterized protein n=1 Tax=Thalictrum thalictroides TaxID=46969 RepID=A0A7J6USC4_THATH|nr:hypothetical protein FRX31_035059 [Thalictrum thalictroides]
MLRPQTSVTPSSATSQQSRGKQQSMVWTATGPHCHPLTGSPRSGLARPIINLAHQHQGA